MLDNRDEVKDLFISFPVSKIEKELIENSFIEYCKYVEDVSRSEFIRRAVFRYVISIDRKKEKNYEIS